MNLIKKNGYKLGFIVYTSILPVVSLAQVESIPCDAPGSGKLCNPISINSIPEFIQTLLENVIRVGIPIVALAIIYSGFLFVAARGNAEKITKAKSALLYSVIGAAILLGSWAIAEMISATVAGLK